MDTAKKMLNRRRVLKGALATWLTAGSTPFAIGKEKPVLRALGTHVTLQEPLRLQAEQDLGIRIQFEPGGSAIVLQKASMNPLGFDLYEQWSNSINVLWRANAIQPIETSKIRHWDELNGLTKTGKVTANAQIGAGDAPHKIINVQADNSLSTGQTGKISFLPYVHNVDSFGYLRTDLPDSLNSQHESWGWLLDSRFSGKVGIVNDPTIGLFDLALAAQAKGFIQFADIGAITHDELDKLFSLLIELKQLHHFSGFWTSVPESVHFMRSGRVLIESMFSPAVSELNGQNIPVTFAAPVEGYRGWHGVMCLSSTTQGRNKDVAYEYMNWWLSGWPGAFIARQGYYISNPQRSKPYLSDAEWDYWYEGEPASEALKGPDGKISVHKGEQRTGGSYENRFSRVAVWNTVMPTYEYSLQKWYEFITS